MRKLLLLCILVLVPATYALAQSCDECEPNYANCMANGGGYDACQQQLNDCRQNCTASKAKQEKLSKVISDLTEKAAKGKSSTCPANYGLAGSSQGPLCFSRVNPNQVCGNRSFVYSCGDKGASCCSINQDNPCTQGWHGCGPPFTVIGIQGSGHPYCCQDWKQPTSESAAPTDPTLDRQCAGPYGQTNSLDLTNYDKTQWVQAHADTQFCGHIPTGKSIGKLRCDLFVPGGDAYHAYCKEGSACGLGAQFRKISMKAGADGTDVCADVHGAEINSMFTLAVVYQKPTAAVGRQTPEEATKMKHRHAYYTLILDGQYILTGEARQIQIFDYNCNNYIGPFSISGGNQIPFYACVNDSGYADVAYENLTNGGGWSGAMLLHGGDHISP